LLCVPSNVARQRFGEHVPAATNTHATTVLLDVMFLLAPRRVKYSVSSVRKLGD
jgi:hypothetical protein